MTSSKPKTGCIFCVPAEDLTVFQGTTAYVILNKYPYNNGHLMVVPYRHVSTLGELSTAEIEEIELRGFGSFRLRKREPRKGRNPKTGDKVDVPPKKVPYFKPGKELKDLINREAEAAAVPVPAALPDTASV